MTDHDDEPVTRWYQEPWAWLVMGVPAAAVVVCAVMITIAVRAWDGLVVDDYYKRGLAINEVLHREDRARALGLRLRIEALRSGTCEFTLRWDRPAEQLPDSVPVLLSHATHDAGDRRLMARNLGGGRYRVDPGVLAPGPWYVDVATPRWRLLERAVVR